MSAAAAAIILRRERDLVETFRREGALSDTAAQPLERLGVREGMTFSRLSRRGVIVRGNGGWFLDEGAWERYRDRQSSRLLAATIVIVFVATLVVMALLLT